MILVQGLVRHIFKYVEMNLEIIQKRRSIELYE